MKSYVIGAGIIILLCFGFVCAMDFQILLTEQGKLDRVAQDAANSAVLNLDRDKYSDGYIVLDYDKTVQSIFGVLDSTYDFDGASFNSTSLHSKKDRYVKDNIHYHVVIHDEEAYKEYEDGVLTRSESTSNSIPYVSVGVELGELKYLSSFFNSLNIETSSTKVYEIVTDR